MQKVALFTSPQESQMIFLAIVVSSFLYGAVKGYRQWQEQVAVPPTRKGWRN